MSPTLEVILALARDHSLQRSIEHPNSATVAGPVVRGPSVSNNKVYANGRTIVHKGDGQVNASAPPDVCKTPSPGGPVLTPYVNVAKSKDLTDGTKRTKIDGKPVAIDGAKISTSTGNEAGTAGGGLLSSKTKGKLTWATKSPNVKFEGKGVIRFMDTALHNGNTFNTSFIQQGGTGMAYGDDFDGPCPLCKKSPDKHQIKEMKESSAKIASDILKRLHANPRRYAKTVLRQDRTVRLKGYMVGVLVCNCKIWATTSGSTQEHFHEAAPGCVTVGGGAVENFFEGADQLAGGGLPLLVGQLDGLPADQRLQVFGELVHRRHGGAVEQHRDDADVALQGGAGFEADEVVRVVQPAAAAGVFGVEPFVADQHDQHPARGDGTLDGVDKVGARLDPFHVHEHAVGAEVGGQAVVQPAGVAGRVVASVADENPVHGRCPHAVVLQA